VRKKTALVVLLAAVCYILGLVTASYFPIPAHLGAALTRLLHGRVRPFMVSRNFNETNLDEIQTFLYYEKQIPGKIDLVDVSFSSKEDFLKKHRLFLERPVLEDLYWLIRDDYPAANDIS
jgi:hypothetical protein